MTTQQNEKPVKAILGTKLGMTQVWDEDGKLVPVTVVAVETNVVTQVRTADVDGCTGCNRPDRPTQGDQAAQGAL